MAKPTVTLTSRNGPEAIDTDQIIAKRLAGNPFSGGTTEIPLKDAARWVVRVGNGDQHPSRLYELAHKLGYTPVTEADLPDGLTPVSIGFQVSPSGALCRGPRGQEVVFKIPRDAKEQIQWRKDHMNRRGMGTATAVKRDIVEAAGAGLGDEAATGLDRHLHVHGADTLGPRPE